MRFKISVLSALVDVPSRPRLVRGASTYFMLSTEIVSGMPYLSIVTMFVRTSNIRCGPTVCF